MNDEFNPEDLEGCCQEMSALYDNHPFAPLAIYLGVTEALQIIHHSHHFQTRGASFYADHLLFQRLYEGIAPEIDTLGEKVIGLTNEPKLTNYFVRMKVIQKFMEMVTTPDPYVVVSLKAEKLYLMVGKFILEHFEQNQLASRGLVNLVEGILDHHEENVFLLQSRLDGTASKG